MVIVRYGPAVILAAGGAHHLDETVGRLLTVGPSYIGTLDFVLPLALLGLALVVHRRQWLLPAWLLLLLFIPGGEGRYAAIVWAMLAATGTIAIAEAVRSAGALRITAGIGFAWLFAASLLASYHEFYAIPRDVRDAIVSAGSHTPPGTRFAVVIDEPRLQAVVLDWFPTLSGRISVGTYQGLEWTSVAKSDATLALNDQIQAGDIPASAEFIFRVSQGSASWEPAR
jgi:hypothetical protein